MTRLGRRQLLTAGAAAAVASPLRALAFGTLPQSGDRKPQPLDLKDYQPKSMLHVKESRVEQPRFPVIDVHMHLGFATRSQDGVPSGEEMTYIWPPERLLPIMDRKNLRIAVNLTGGAGKGLEESIRRYDKAHPGRFVTFVEPWYDKANDPGYARFQADQIASAHRAGAKGLKVLKVLGLYLRENITSGQLLKVDDKRFDLMWEACAALEMPVAIHVSDPEAFFLPIDRFNERFEELNNHPDWSFYGKDYPSNQEILEARNRVYARHPKTQFITLHFGNDAENLAYVSECMDRFPNMHVEMAARVGELGRQPRTARKFFDKFQDRIMFGTDAVPEGYETPQQVFGDQLYEIYYRFLETEDEYFDYAPAPVPPQGRWRISGLGLPEQILRKVYYENAARLLKVRI
jgi:predicted TIM-barrel fold metal-dependent hydrolase